MAKLADAPDLGFVTGPRNKFAPLHGCEHARPRKNRNDGGTVNMVSTAPRASLVMENGWKATSPCPGFTSRLWQKSHK